MLTSAQQEWVDHLSTDSKIRIIPFDPTSQEKFEKIKAMVSAAVGESVLLEHRGATSLGISGQDEIDTYLPVSLDSFNDYVAKLTKIFGEPKSVYPGNRIHFITYERGKRIDIYLINKDAASWLDGVKFENYLKTHPEALERYKILKEEGDGLSVREYYQKKIEFINEILNLAA
jgi:GrpB-like predicted nucleotidyltransferase (UPF0157 family)